MQARRGEARLVELLDLCAAGREWRIGLEVGQQPVRGMGLSYSVQGFLG